MLANLQKSIHLMARYFIYGLGIQLLMLQIVLATGIHYNGKNVAVNMLSKMKVSEDIIIGGKVVDEEGNPIPGAAILVKETSTGTSTDIDGNFSLEVPEEAVLVVSFLGFVTQEIEVGNQTDFDITLIEDTAQLDEVVVVGFGTQKKSHLTAAVEQIGSELIENRPINRLSEALQGAVAGLYVTPVNGGPAQESNLNIRGYTGFGQKGGPLV
ncbi:MAG: carboxypeptidase-like regulatory domain-containing protein, partial [Cyclobacteriaceae bacterium]